MIASLSEIKAILQITDTTKDAAILALIRPVESYILRRTRNQFEVDRKYPISYFDNRFADTGILYLFSDTISFVSGAPATILDSAGNFLNAGFRPNFHVNVSQTQYNDAIYKIASVEAGILTLETGETLTSEASGYYTMLKLAKIPEGIKIPLAKIIGIELQNSIESGNITSETVGNTSFTYAGISGAYPKDILDQLRPWTRIA